MSLAPYQVASEKRHVTEKPLPLMHELLRIAFDPDAVERRREDVQRDLIHPATE